MITHADVETARERIAPYVRRTPTIRLEAGDLAACVVKLKLESLQHTGSFKARGAFNRILQLDPDRPIVAASGGNHGMAVAYAAATLGRHAEIFVPSLASPVKLARLKKLAKTLNVIEGAYADAALAARERVAELGAAEVPPFEHPEVAAGQGTAALEFMEDATFDTLLVAVGGGGLAAGMAAALPAGVKIVGVETRGTASYAAALKAGEPADAPAQGIAADSLGSRRVGKLCFETLVKRGMSSLVVEDEQVAAAQRTLWDRLRMAAEPGGATAAAALLSGVYAPQKDERVAMLICGGNVDPGLLV